MRKLWKTGHKAGFWRQFRRKTIYKWEGKKHSSVKAHTWGTGAVGCWVWSQLGNVVESGGRHACRKKQGQLPGSQGVYQHINAVRPYPWNYWYILQKRDWGKQGRAEVQTALYKHKIHLELSFLLSKKKHVHFAICFIILAVIVFKCFPNSSSRMNTQQMVSCLPTHGRVALGICKP